VPLIVVLGCHPAIVGEMETGSRDRNSGNSRSLASSWLSALRGLAFSASCCPRTKENQRRIERSDLSYRGGEPDKRAFVHGRPVRGQRRRGSAAKREWHGDGMSQKALAQHCGASQHRRRSFAGHSPHAADQAAAPRSNRSSSWNTGSPA
jgi:hypothetical protein